MHTPDEVLERRKAFVVDLLRGRILGDGPTERQACVAEDVVYTSVRHVAVCDRSWLDDELACVDPLDRAAVLVRECMSPGFGALRDSLYCERRPLDQWTFAERIIINTRADDTADVAEWLIDEVLDDVERFPGVGLLRVRGPRTIGTFADAIVVLMNDGGASTSVVEALRGFQRQFPSIFLTDVPPRTRRVFPGVAVAEES